MKKILTLITILMLSSSCQSNDDENLKLLVSNRYMANEYIKLAKDYHELVADYKDLAKKYLVLRKECKHKN